LFEQFIFKIFRKRLTTKLCKTISELHDLKKW